ncbi:MAG: hypothetical protein E5X64_22000, partial [Mesorhizobium sp.]
MTDPSEELASMLKDKMFDVEHALGMYATSYVIMPAAAIYDERAVGQFGKTLSTCHIYVIGLMPRIDFAGAREESGGVLVTSFEVAGATRELRWPLPPGARLMYEDEFWYVVDAEGHRSFPDIDVAVKRLSDELDAISFEVLYIGQAYGKDGSRNALDRLLKHETLQKISLQGIPDGYRLNLLLLEVQPATTMFTVFNPFAKDTEQGSRRISSGLDKLFNTSEAERISVYEASLIRYFQPRYNKEFKNSFPSTNMKVLADCYDKD